MTDISTPVDPLDPTPSAQDVDAETEYDLLFPTVPIEDDLTPPDTVDEQLVDDIADFASDERPLDTGELGPNEQGADFAMDWDSEEFFSSDRGDPLRVEGDDAVIEWCQKAAYTRRGEYPIYGPDYGCNIADLIGSGLPDDILYSEVARELVEAFTQHKRIDRAEVLAIQRVEAFDRAALLVTVEVTLDTSVDPVAVDLRF